MVVVVFRSVLSSVLSSILSSLLMAVVVFRFALHSLSHIVFPFIAGKGHTGAAKDHKDNNTEDVRCFHRFSPIVPKNVDITCQKHPTEFEGIASIAAILHPMRCVTAFSMADTSGCDSINHAKPYRCVFSMLRLYFIVGSANMGTFGRTGSKIAYLAETIGS